MSTKNNEEELLRAWLRDRDVPCPGCGYNLRGLTRNVCPECGEVVILGITTIRHRLWSWPAAVGVLAAVLVFTALIAVLALAKLWDGVGWENASWELLVAAVVFGVGAGYAGLCVWYWRKSRRGASGLRRL